MNFKEILSNIENLAKLRIEDEQAFVKHLERMVEAFKVLKEVDTEGVEPLVDPLEGISPLREDIVKRGLDRITALNLAPEKYMEYYKAPSPIKERKSSH